MGQEIVLVANPDPFRIVPSRSNLNFPEHHALLLVVYPERRAFVWLGQASDRERGDSSLLELGGIEPNSHPGDPDLPVPPLDFAGEFRSTMPDRRRPPASYREIPWPSGASIPALESV